MIIEDTVYCESKPVWYNLKPPFETSITWYFGHFGAAQKAVNATHMIYYIKYAYSIVPATNMLPTFLAH